MNVLKAHENLVNIAERFTQIIVKEQGNGSTTKELRHMSSEMNSGMQQIAKSLPWRDKIAYA